MAVVKLPPLPPLPSTRKPRAAGGGTSRKPTGKKRKKNIAQKPTAESRVVGWRIGVEGSDAEPRAYGTCARCRRRILSTELTWRPDRVVDNLFYQGFWACVGGCNE